MKVGDEMFMRPEKAATATYIANICREIAKTTTSTEYTSTT